VTGEPLPAFRDLVVCSLEPWDDVWRRNQFFVDALLHHLPALRILFVEPPATGAAGLAQLRPAPRPRALREDGRLHALRPAKVIPRRLCLGGDRALQRQVIRASAGLGFTRPLLWINDATYGPLIEKTGWPSVYDITDDWLLAPFPAREIERLRRLEDEIFTRADEIVVCSEALYTSRSSRRPVTLVPNGVDAEHLRRPQSRPADLPASPAAVYVGSLHDARIDVDLVLDLARSIPGLAVVLVGPDWLGPDARARLAAEPNVHLLGARAYREVPAYLQHADVIVVPHRLSAFTESLDPIKAYECLAVQTPTVATPVAGFREHAHVMSIADATTFVGAVQSTLAGGRPARPEASVPTWDDRAAVFEGVLQRAAARAR
jgi:teichuronic acid biosynthesis glycosyltransferase TuaH